MRITTLAEYGVICALHLARRVDEGPITGREIAEREQLPGDYVEQILLRLRRAGHRSQHARRARRLRARAPADEISIRDVIEASETTTFDLHCVSHPVGEERCSSSHNCSIRPVWMLLQQKIDDVLAGRSPRPICSPRRAKCGRASGSSTSRASRDAPRAADSSALAPMPLFARWRAERELQRKAAAFVDALFREPDAARRRVARARRRRAATSIMRDGSFATRGARSD